MWECGLKQYTVVYDPHILQSLPMWECGLKHDSQKQKKEVIQVTPHVGVWIET